VASISAAARESGRAILHSNGLGWALPDGSYLCGGCGVREGHMHRCHGNDGGLWCGCDECRRQPTAAELAAFMEEIS
jgi:hypothetical protein